MCPGRRSDDLHSFPTSETTYREQAQRDGPDELGDAYRARHSCSRRSVLFLQEGLSSSGGGAALYGTFEAQSTCDPWQAESVQEVLHDGR